MRADKFLVCLFVALVLGAGVVAHINQGESLESARMEEARLDAMGCVGWMVYSESTGQFEFSGR